MNLTARQQRFAQEYLVDLNGLQAALRAGYTPQSAKKNSTRLLTNPLIKDFIAKKQAEIAQKIDLNAQTVLKELLAIATSDLRKAFNDDGSLKDMKDIPDDVAKALAGIDIDELYDMEYEGGKAKKVEVGRTKKIKLWDKNKALELLARHLSLLNDKLEVNHNFNFAEKLKAARERSRDAFRAAHSNN